MPAKHKPTKRTARKRKSTPRRRPTSSAPRRAAKRKKNGAGSRWWDLGEAAGLSGKYSSVAGAWRDMTHPKGAAEKKAAYAAFAIGYAAGRLRRPNPVKLRVGKSVSLRGRKSIKLVKRNGKPCLEVR